MKQLLVLFFLVSCAAFQNQTFDEQNEHVIENNARSR